MRKIPKDLYSFKNRYLDIDSLRLHYLDEGEGEPVVAVHGNPTWSFYYRDLVRALRDDYRVIVPDHMVTKTRELLLAGMDLAVRTWARAAEALGWTVDAIDHFVVHQVSKVHTEQFAGILGIDLTKVFRLYPDYGNVGPAGVPIALSKLEESGRLERGQRVAILGIGSGINCTMAELLW